MFWEDALHPPISLQQWRFSIIRTSIPNRMKTKIKRYDGKIKKQPTSLAGGSAFTPIRLTLQASP